MLIAKVQKTVIACLLITVAACSDSSKSVDREGENVTELKTDCSPGEVDTLGHVGIINGKTVQYGSWLEKSTVLLLARTIKGDSACTATIISKNVLLTAAHCVLKTEKNMARKQTIDFALFSANPLCQKDILASRKVHFKDVYVHPDYKSDVTGLNDVALIRLENSVPYGFVPMKVIDEEQMAQIEDPSTVFIGAGFGKTLGYKIEDEYAPRLRATEMSYVLTKDQNFVFDQRKKGLCAGDSGGPIFAKISGSPVVAAVNSAVAPLDGSEDCRGIGYANTIQYHREILRKGFDEIAPYEKNPF